ncbi:MAG: hypothetical protein JW818_14680 [Pirellulales bacterium]|nr:hypothetical protein [Pirellulales bacterium]
MNGLLLATLENCDLWYALPLIVAVSLVYSATHFEQTGQILHNAVRTGVWIVSFMAVVFGVLLLLGWMQ